MLPTLSNWVGRLLAIAGLAGIVLFFPFHVCHQHTCLFEHLMTDCKRNGMVENLSIAELLRHYLLPYAILWWLSIVVATLAIAYNMRQHWYSNFHMRSSQNFQRR